MPAPCRITELRPGVWHAECVIHTRDGDVRIEATCPEAPLRRLIAFELARRAPAGANTAGLFESIGRFAKHLTKRKTLGQIARGVRDVARSPIFQAAVAAAGTAFGVPPNVSMGAVKMAGELASQVAKNDPYAKRHVRELAAKAAAGDPAAVQAIATYRAAAAVQQATVTPRTSGGRLVQMVRLPDGRTVEIGGAMWEHIKREWGWQRHYRPKGQKSTMRDAYLSGQRAYVLRQVYAARRRR